MENGAERSLDRAITALKELLAAELRAVRAELVGVNRRLDALGHTERRVEDHTTRIYALERVQSMHGREIAEQKQHDDHREEVHQAHTLTRRQIVVAAIGVSFAGVALVLSAITALT